LLEKHETFPTEPKLDLRKLGIHVSTCVISDEKYVRQT